MKTIRVKPILVETNSSFLYLHNGKLYNNRHTMHILDGKQIPQQLVLISLDPNNKIEVGYYAVSDSGYLIKVKSIDDKELSFIPLQTDVYCNKETFHDITRYKKVIATQDQLSPEYIQRFVEEYNKNEVKDVEIEMKLSTPEWVGPFDSNVKIEKPKLTNGFVTVVNNEPIIYTEEEVKCLINEYSKQTQHECRCTVLNPTKWFEINKKKQVMKQKISFKCLYNDFSCTELDTSSCTLLKSCQDCTHYNNGVIATGSFK